MRPYDPINGKGHPMCQWFLMCTNEAIATVRHPILGDVPVCARCKAFAEGKPRNYLD
jgi:hypothetical protein